MRTVKKQCIPSPHLRKRACALEIVTSPHHWKRVRAKVAICEWRPARPGQSIWRYHLNAPASVHTCSRLYALVSICFRSYMSILTLTMATISATTVGSGSNNTVGVFWPNQSSARVRGWDCWLVWVNWDCQCVLSRWSVEGSFINRNKIRWLIRWQLIRLAPDLCPRPSHQTNMKDLAAEFRSEVTIQFGLVTDITLMDVGLEPLRGFITSFRQRFPAPIAQLEYRVQPQRQVCSLCPV